MGETSHEDEQRERSARRLAERKKAVLAQIRRAGARGATRAEIADAAGLPEPLVAWLLGALVGWSEIGRAPHSGSGDDTRYVALRTSRGSLVDELTVPGGETL